MHAGIKKPGIRCEKEFSEKLGMNEKEFGELLKSKKRDEGFKQALSDAELEAANGGGSIVCSELLKFALCGLNGSGDGPCQHSWKRNIYDGGFPNCDSTVEDGSWCGSNDACFFDAIQYQGMKDCTKAWK